jgi:hypothetical protein
MAWPNQFVSSGTTTPVTAGAYAPAGVLNSQALYYNAYAAMFLYYDLTSAWTISTIAPAGIGQINVAPYKTQSNATGFPNGTYDIGSLITGTATVAAGTAWSPPVAANTITVRQPLGTLATLTLICDQGEAKPFLFTLLDPTGQSVDQTGKAFNLVIESLLNVYVSETNGVVINANQVYCLLPQSMTANAGAFKFVLWDRTTDTIAATGPLSILAAAQPV